MQWHYLVHLLHLYKDNLYMFTLIIISSIYIYTQIKSTQISLILEYYSCLMIYFGHKIINNNVNNSNDLINVCQ